MPSCTAPGTWRQWMEPWYLAYALLGVAVGGVVSIAVPLRYTARATWKRQAW